MLSKIESLMVIAEFDPVDVRTAALAEELMFSKRDPSMFKLDPDVNVMAAPCPELFKSFKVELIKLTVPLFTDMNPPPLLPPLTKVKLIKLISAPVLNI